MTDFAEIKGIASSFRKAYWIQTGIRIFFVVSAISGLAYSAISSDIAETDHIAVIDIKGNIGGNGYSEDGQKISDNILKAIRNKHAKAIILMANSPGGAPTHSQMVYDLIDDYRESAEVAPQLLSDIKAAVSDKTLKFMPELDDDQSEKKSETESGSKYRLPIVAVVGDMCASACVQAVIRSDLIIAQRSSLFGNIGVRLDSINWSELANKLGVTNVTIASSPDKDSLNSWKPIDQGQVEKAKAEIVMPVYEQFKADMLHARPLLKPNVFDGSIWTGIHARQIGLVDEIATPVQVQQAMKLKFHWKLKNYTPKTMSISSMFSQATGIKLNRDTLIFR